MVDNVLRRDLARLIYSTETKWGLGLKHLDDMPLENIFNLGLVRLTSQDWEILSLTRLVSIHGSTIVGFATDTRFKKKN